MKVCTNCGRALEETNFQRRTASRDGLTARCKRCLSLYEQGRADQPHRVQARENYSKTPHGKARLNAGQMVYAVRHPDKRRAQVALGNAVRDGRVTIPRKCQNPGCNSSGPLQAHHDDYSKPLVVRWLCVPCHRFHHKTERRQPEMKGTA